MKFSLCLSACLFYFQLVCDAIDVKPKGIDHNPAMKTITLITPDGKLAIMIDYARGCVIKKLDLNGKNKLAHSGAYTGFRTQKKT
ncbi:MAG: hypothetical protein ACRDE7_11230, partial [Sphingobacterium sp.]